jgi:peptidoglycan/LPS O-acetylase OafA/YrhL
VARGPRPYAGPSVPRRSQRFSGSEWVVAHFFWMDLLFGLGVACTLTLLYAGGGVRMRGVLASRTAIWLGLFSYSIYLVHDPIVGVLSKYAVGPMDLPPLAAFGLMLVVGLPLVLAFCYGFHLLFEAPFLRHRSFSALRTLPIVRLIPGRRRQAAAPKAVAPAEEAAGRGIVAGRQPATGEQAAG